MKGTMLNRSAYLFNSSADESINKSLLPKSKAIVTLIHLCTQMSTAPKSANNSFANMKAKHNHSTINSLYAGNSCY